MDERSKQHALNVLTKLFVKSKNPFVGGRAFRARLEPVATTLDQQKALAMSLVPDLAEHNDSNQVGDSFRPTLRALCEAYPPAPEVIALTLEFFRRKSRRDPEFSSFTWEELQSSFAESLGDPDDVEDFKQGAVTQVLAVAELTSGWYGTHWGVPHDIEDLSRLRTAQELLAWRRRHGNSDPTSRSVPSDPESCANVTLRNRTVLALAEVVAACFDFSVNVNGRLEPRTRPDLLGDFLYSYEFPAALVSHARNLPTSPGVIKAFVLELDIRGGQGPSLGCLARSWDEAPALSQRMLKQLAEAVLTYIHTDTPLVKPSSRAVDRLTRALADDGHAIPEQLPVAKGGPSHRPAAGATKPRTAKHPSHPEHEGNSPLEQTRIFVSHSSTDREVAKALIACLESALKIPDNAIRCTSVDGYKLRPGDHGSTTLRDNIASSCVVIGLITQGAINSGYVVMELGAAWGLKVATAPILHPSLDFNQIPGPLGETHGVKADDRAGLVSLIETIADLTGYDSLSPTRLSTAVEDFLSRLQSIWTQQ